jgi:predicted enzyme related to lactoylglutathione lyase
MPEPAPPATAGFVIYAKDVEALAKFYQSVLTLEIVDRHETFVLLQGGAVEIVVVQIPEEIAATIELTKPPTVRTGSPIKPMFTVQSLIDVRSRVFGNGGTLQPEEAAWKFRGAIVLDGCDREGNVIQFRQLDR